MSGGPDPLYVAARAVLLDALEALGQQRSAVILVGAQAIYLHTGDAELAVAAYTTDGDLAIDPGRLRPEPLLEAALRDAGFVPGDAVGSWISRRTVDNAEADVAIDLMVPASVGGPGRRAARLGSHGERVARKARGLEAALVDNRVHTIAALESADRRVFEIAIAGPAALLVGKLHKIAERTSHPRRESDKDALDVLRLLQATSTDELAETVKTLLAGGSAREVTREAMTHLHNLFSTSAARGALMAARAAAPLENPEMTAASCAALASELLAGCED